MNLLIEYLDNRKVCMIEVLLYFSVYISGAARTGACYRMSQIKACDMGKNNIIISPDESRRRRNFLVDAITQKQINIFFSNLVHILRVPKGRSLF